MRNIPDGQGRAEGGMRLVGPWLVLRWTLVLGVACLGMACGENSTTGVVECRQDSGCDVLADVQRDEPGDVQATDLGDASIDDRAQAWDVISRDGNGGEAGLRDEGAEVCTPNCADSQCGDDGCGRNCGTCQDDQVCQSGRCVCKTQDHKACCGNAVCWFDSCGVQGDRVVDCPNGCDGAKVECASCVPSCGDQECGENGCGGECAPGCSGGQVCDAGQCICAANDHLECLFGDVYWYDSCGVQGLAHTCDCGCTGAQCNCCPGCADCRSTDTSDGCGGTCQSNCIGTCDGSTCCATDDHQACSGGDLYWFDSCGTQGAMAQACDCDCWGSACCCSSCADCRSTDTSDGCGGTCPANCNGTCDGATCCEAEDHQACSGGDDLYWYDSCGTQGALAKACDCGCSVWPTECKCCPSCAECRTTEMSDGCAGTCPANCNGTCDGTTCCKANDHQACADENMYWFDSCGTVGARASWCVCGCTGAACDCCPECLGQFGPMQCGEDNCGGTCGTCGADSTCQSGYCLPKCPEGYVFVLAGTFTMGSPVGEPGRDAGETQHEVTISRDHCVKATEVTQGEWQAVMGMNPTAWNLGGSYPVDSVSWWEALAYCNQLSRNDGLQECYAMTGCVGTLGGSCPRNTGATDCQGDYACSGLTFAGVGCAGYRLPTEAEWEYAARAGTTTGTYNGTSSLTGMEHPNSVLDPIAWFFGDALIGGSLGQQTVKGKLPNEWGLFDMLGNASEWVWDSEGTYPTGSLTDPTGGLSAGNRMVRGGNLISFASGTRAAARSSADPRVRSMFWGLRPVRGIAP